MARVELNSQGKLASKISHSCLLILLNQHFIRRNQFMENKKPSWASLAICILGILVGALLAINGIIAFRTANGNGITIGEGVVFLIAGLALAVFGVFGGFISKEGCPDLVGKVALYVGAIFSFAWGLSSLIRSGRAHGGSLAAMIIIGILYLIICALLVLGALKGKGGNDVFTIIAFCASAFLTIVIAGSMALNSSMTIVQVVAILLGILLSAETGLKCISLRRFLKK